MALHAKKSHVIRQEDRIKDHYKIEEKLGSGNFATVHKTTRIKDSKEFAVKVIKKHKLDAEETKSLHAEIDIMHKVNHQFCVKLYEVFDQPKHLYLIMDLLRGGELFDRIVAKGHFSEKDAAEVIRDVAEALKYLHEIGVVHRDLKPENLIYLTKADDAPVKITDFGLAKYLRNPAGVMSTQCGTPGYVAPEVLAGKGYDHQVDMWSLGVILYIMLCGYPPFYAENDAELFHQIQKADYDMPPEDWDQVSPEAKQLVKALLTLDPKKRPTAADVLKHKWVTSKDTSTTKLGDRHMRNFRLHQARQKMRRAIDFVLAMNRFRRMFAGHSDSEKKHKAKREAKRVPSARHG